MITYGRFLSREERDNYYINLDLLKDPDFLMSLQLFSQERSCELLSCSDCPLMAIAKDRGRHGRCWQLSDEFYDIQFGFVEIAPSLAKEILEIIEENYYWKI